MDGLVRDRAGFRLRGLHMTRIETFTDAAFAFALTLLVISLDPPTSFDGLVAALHDVPAFLLSAAMLMMFWWAHHEWSRRYGIDDFRTFLLSSALVCTVLVYVYPLRSMFGAMMTWIGSMTGLAALGGVTISQPGDVNSLFVIYGIGFTAMSAAILLLHAHAWARREQLQLDAVERHHCRADIGAWLILCTTGALSIFVAAAVPPTLVGLPGWVYATLGVVMPLYGRAMDRRRPAPQAQQDTAGAASYAAAP